MGDHAFDQGHSRASDVLSVVVYSILVVLIILAWIYVPA
jgi:hypothetical protein